MANIRAVPYGPTRPAHVQVGAFYRVHGSDTFGDTIPDQIIRILRPAVPGPLLMRATMVCEAWVYLLLDGFDQMMDYHESTYPLDAVNVDEHGEHDRHLERIELDPSKPFEAAIIRKVIHG